MFALIGGNSTSNSVISDGGCERWRHLQDVVAKLPSDEIQVDSSPSAAVFLDGESKGKAPLKLKVKAGTHKLLIVADSFKLWKQEASGGQTISAKLIKASLPDDVSGTAAVKVKCKRDGELRILVDGNDSGLSCPTDDLMLKPGKYTLGFFEPDFRRAARKIDQGKEEGPEAESEVLARPGSPRAQAGQHPQLLDVGVFGHLTIRTHRCQLAHRQLDKTASRFCSVRGTFATAFNCSKRSTGPMCGDGSALLGQHVAFGIASCVPSRYIGNTSI